jgi:exodeoxyribonuclease V beta subunit
MEQAPLAALLHPQLAPDGILPAAPDEATLVAALARLSHAGAGAIEVAALPRPEGPAPLPVAAAPELAARVPARQVLPARRTLSFSALAASGTDAAVDHDGGDPARLGDPLAEVGPIAAYPRGARVGECVHLALERIDFAQWPDAAGRASLDLACRRFRFGEAEREVFEDWIGQALNATLLPGLTLAALEPAASARELEFHFRLAGTARRLEAALALEPRHARDAAAIARLPARMSGLMHGYIDLVLRHQERWYVVDYKTNFLGGELSHYAPQSLAVAVREGDYDLQYLIYLVALHRQLRHRLGRAYDPERQLGGALYLFLRGMSRDGAHGVHRDRPPVALIEALDRAFDDGGEAPWP